MALLSTIFNIFTIENLSFILTIFVVFLTILLLYLQHINNYWKKHKIAFIKPKLLFGNISDVIYMKKSVNDTINEFYHSSIAKDQAVLGIYIFNRPSLVIRDVELVKRILIKDFNKFSNRFSTSDPHSDPLGSDNLFFVKNPKWKQLRQKLTPVFTSGKLRQMFPLVVEVGEQLDAYLCNLTKNANDKTIIREVKDINTLYSIDVISTVAWGVQAHSLSNPNGIFRTAGKRIFDFTTYRALEVYSMFFAPKLVKIFGFKFFSPKTNEFLRNIINQVIAERTASGLVRNDLIDLLINFKREAEAVTDKKHFILEGDSLIAQATVFFSAGFETSSSTMSFSLFELAWNQDVQALLRAEIRDALSENDGKITYEKLNEMKYLDNVIREVLRLYPIMPFLDRECTLSDDDEKNGYSLKPYCDFEIPNGMPVYVPLYSLQRDEKYFPEPLRFNPDRFSTAQSSENNMSAYLPFGMGPHNCIGERFGIVQTKIGLIHFLRNHCVKPSPQLSKEMKMNPRALFLQTIEGIPLNVIYDPLI